MIFVDSSVWIDYLRRRPSPPAQRLDAVLGIERIVIGDLVLAEVLQGVIDEQEFLKTRSLMLAAGPIIDVSGRTIALKAAENYRFLRTRGITVRKTIDALIATRCIQEGFALLHNDRDFQPFIDHLGLSEAMAY